MFHLRRARDLIDRHFAEPLDLDAMARAAGFSRYHFARGFRAAYGETPGQYLTRRRIERAQDLLRSANLTVTEICHQVGVLQPRVVQRDVLCAGRGAAERVPARARRARGAPRARMLRDGVGPAR